MALRLELALEVHGWWWMCVIGSNLPLVKGFEVIAIAGNGNLSGDDEDAAILAVANIGHLVDFGPELLVDVVATSDDGTEDDGALLGIGFFGERELKVMGA
jgi:hypothetical protein